MKKEIRSENIVMLTASEGCVLRRVGELDTFGAVTVGAHMADAYEEVTADQAAADRYAADCRASYEELVGKYVREGYTAAAEFAILRQRDTKPDEYATYNAFCEACKARARREVYTD